MQPQIISVSNFNDNNVLEKTFLSEDVAPGSAGPIPVQNTQGFAKYDHVVVGNLGSETSETFTVDTVASSVLLPVTDAAKLKHDRGEQVTRLFGNALNLYRAPNTDGKQPDDSAFVLVSPAPVPLNSDQLMTDLQDPDGSDAWWYKYTYVNTVSGAETSVASSNSARGGSVGDYVTVEAIRNEAGFSNAAYISDDMIDQKRKAAQGEINGALGGQYQVPFSVPVDDVIREIALQLAAGMLQVQQFGRYATKDTNNGQSRMDWAYAQIEKIKSGQLVLSGADGVPDGQKVTSNASGYPTGFSVPGFMFERNYIEPGERHW